MDKKSVHTMYHISVCRDELLVPNAHPDVRHRQPSTHPGAEVAQSPSVVLEDVGTADWPT